MEVRIGEDCSAPSRSRYIHQGCRCPGCTDAQSAYQHARYTPATPVALAEPTPPWFVEANCRGVDPELFFPERGGDSASPKAVCAGCTVRSECLELALANNERAGIWGGTSERERRAIRRKRAGVAA